MPLDFVDVNSAPFCEWSYIRETLRDLAVFTFAADTPRVFDDMKVEINPLNGMLKTTAELKPSAGTYAGKIFAVMFGISTATLVKNEDNQTEYIGGGHSSWNWLLNVDAWVIIENDGKGAARKKAENMARLLTAAIKRNVEIMVGSDPNQLWRGIEAPDFPTIELQPFSEGFNAFVAQGTTTAIVGEALTV